MLIYESMSILSTLNKRILHVMATDTINGEEKLEEDPERTIIYTYTVGAVDGCDETYCNKHIEEDKNGRQFR